jgi:hypothetical protein
MARDRDVAAFGERAPRYDEGWLGQLGQLAARAPQAEVLAGIDPAAAMIEAASGAATDDRLRFVTGTAERPPWPAGLHSPQWHRLNAVIIQAVTAIK